MPRLVSMANLVLRCQRRCDMENNPHVDSTVGGEWYALLSEQFGELYGIVAESGMRYYETATQFIPAGATIAQPADHLATIGIDWIVNTSTGERRELVELMVQERQQYAALRGGDTVAFSLAGQTFSLWPTPAGTGRTFELLYIPQPPDLTLLSAVSTVDVVNADGEGFLVWGACVKALAKEEADTGLAERERERYRMSLTEWASLRAFNTPRRRQISEIDSDAFYPGNYDSADWRYR